MGGWLAEDSREDQDEGQSRHNETETSEDGAKSPPQPPGTEDGELGRSRTRQEVGRCHPVLEVLGINPATLLNTHLSKQGDMRWRPAEANTAKTGPLSCDGDKRYPLRVRVRRGEVAAHSASSPRTSLASSRSCCLVVFSSRRPLSVVVYERRTRPSTTWERDRMSPSASILWSVGYSEPGLIL